MKVIANLQVFIRSSHFFGIIIIVVIIVILPCSHPDHTSCLLTS